MNGADIERVKTEFKRRERRYLLRHAIIEWVAILVSAIAISIQVYLLISRL